MRMDPLTSFCLYLPFSFLRGMNATRCHVELSKAPTPEQVKDVEDRLNLYIRRNYPVHVTFTEERPPTMPKGIFFLFFLFELFTSGYLELI